MEVGNPALYTVIKYLFISKLFADQKKKTSVYTKQSDISSSWLSL